MKKNIKNMYWSIDDINAALEMPNIGYDSEAALKGFKNYEQEVRNRHKRVSGENYDERRK